MKIAFVKDLKLSKRSTNLLLKINEVIDIYAEQGYQLTLRQLYYRLVTRNILVNNQNEYDKLGNLLTKGRMAGIVDWEAIVDRVRSPRITYAVDDINHAVSDAVDNYRLDRQKGQENYIELWVEKDALSEVLSRRTSFYHVRLMVNRGYSSTTAMFDSFERFVFELAEGRTANVLYLGDHDPSGLDMVRDIKVRILRMLTNQPFQIAKYVKANYNRLQKELKPLAVAYAKEYGYGEDDLFELFEQGDEPKKGVFDVLKFYCYRNFQIKHIALKTEQVNEFDLTPNPAKLLDPRAAKYIALHGDTSWEVDALEPKTLHEIIDTAVEELIDKAMFEAQIKLEEEQKAELAKVPFIMADYPELEKRIKTDGETIDTLRQFEEDHNDKMNSIKELIKNARTKGKGVEGTKAVKALNEIKKIVEG